MRNFTSLLFAGGLGFFLLVLAADLPVGAAPMAAGQGILGEAPEGVGAANLVTAVVLAYRGFDTLGELSILFAAAAGVGLILSGMKRRADARPVPQGGFILLAAADLLFPLLVIVGLYIVLHGHLSPGGGFQGGVILAAAFFLPLLGRPGDGLGHGVVNWIEGLAGGTFICIGLWALVARGDFLAPMLGEGALGALLSAGTLPLLYIAVGLKVGAEIAGLMSALQETETAES